MLGVWVSVDRRGSVKIHASVYDILPGLQQDGARKRCSECGLV